MKDTSLLMSALVTASQQAAEFAWRRWRREIDVSKLSWRAVQLVPVLDRHQWAYWCADDPEASLLRGIARRAWTEAHLQLKVLRETTALLVGGGIRPVLPAGPCAVFLQNRRADSVRPLPEIQILIPRAHLWPALRILTADGWICHGRTVEANALDWVTHTTLQREGVTLKLFWRHLNVPPWRARECEVELFATADSSMPQEHLMLSLLTPGAPDDGWIPWQVDAALVSLSDLQWQNWSRLACRWVPSAFHRLTELRQAGVCVPFMTRPCVSVARLEELAHRTLRSFLMPLRRWRNHLTSRISSPASQSFNS